jgi:hypothetical protein
MVALSAHAVSLGYALGAALLGFWFFLRHPSLGPDTLRTAFLLVACAYALLLLAAAATGAAEALAGPAVALLCAYLPILAFAFWTALHLMRLTIAMVRP